VPECGDGTCDAATEDCAICPEDCNVCPDNDDSMDDITNGNGETPPELPDDEDENGDINTCASGCQWGYIQAAYPDCSCTPVDTGDDDNNGNGGNGDDDPFGDIGGGDTTPPPVP